MKYALPPLTPEQAAVARDLRQQDREAARARGESYGYDEAREEFKARASRRSAGSARRAFSDEQLVNMSDGAQDPRRNAVVTR